MDLKSSTCLPTDSETKNFIKDNKINYKGKIDDNVKFIAGDCSPIILVPGIYSTRLKVKLNCKNIKRDEVSLYEQIKFYCGENVCTSKLDQEENRNLWFNIGGDGFSLFKSYWENSDEVGAKKKEYNNQYSACLGYFMTIFNNPNECPKYKSSKKKICEYSKNIIISYDGGFYDTFENAQCGLKAIENVLMTPLDIFSPKQANVFGDLVDQLEEYGYKKGFSLAGVPNDFRKFISTNNFAFNAIKYQINNMYSNTGKPVIIIAHSFGNLVTLNALQKDENLKKQIKKWISIAPPFAGATKAVDNFLHGITDFNFDIPFTKGYARSEFSEFGQFLMLKSIPTVYELRPNSIYWEIFNDDNYNDFATAIRERLELEKNCKKNNKCEASEIETKSKNFDNIFGEYFPSFKLNSQCEYETSVGGNQDALKNKCFTEIFNIIDYPSFIKVNPNDDDSYDIEDYYKKTGDNLYYIADCEKISGSKCIDNIFPEVKCVYDAYTSELNDLIDKFYQRTGKKLTRLDFPSSSDLKEIINKMISHHNEKSIIKELKNPQVDIDIVYSSFNPTMAAEFIDQQYLINLSTSKKGGDGTVPTWSSLLTAFKWIYEKKKERTTQNIRLIEYCSRLANTDINLPYFKPISCQCIDKSNLYTNDLESCSHQFMLSDKNLFDYILGEVVKDDKIIANRKNAIEKYDYSSSKKYLTECNSQLYNIMNNEEKQLCSNDIEITKSNFEEGDNYCGKNDNFLEWKVKNVVQFMFMVKLKKKMILMFIIAITLKMKKIKRVHI